MRRLRSAINGQPEWVLLLIAVVVIRSLVPSGFMPSVVGPTITMSMCGVGSPAPVDVRLPPTPAPTAPKHSHDGICPCAATVKLAPTPGVVATRLATKTSSQTPIPPSIQAIASSPHRPQSPRAPPAVFS
jgi:hypothetical protein